MTKLLEEAFGKAAALPAPAQDSLARFLLAELADDAEWDRAFAASQDELALMAQQALAESRAGRTKPLDLRRDF